MLVKLYLTVTMVNVRQIWVQPENPRTLRAAFSKLKELHLSDMFSEGDLSWTMFLLQGAPLLEFLSIQVRTLPLFIYIIPFLCMYP